MCIDQFKASKKKKKKQQLYHGLSIFPTLCFYIGEGNGTPLQYSCLENPMDGGAW